MKSEFTHVNFKKIRHEDLKCIQLFLVHCFKSCGYNSYWQEYRFQFHGIFCVLY